MKEIAICVVLLSAVYGEICDSVPLIQHPTDCNAYFECRRDRFELRHCPGTLHFNSIRRQCDHQDKANCLIISRNSCRSFCHLLPHPDCTMFYSCSSLVAKEELCPNGQHWNVDREMCMFPEDAQCVQGAAPFQPDAIPIERPTLPSTDPPIRTCESVSEFLPHPDCSMFYSCESLVPREELCIEGFHWSTDWGRCMLPEIAQCVEGAAPIQPDASIHRTTAIPPIQPTPETPPSTAAPTRTCESGFDFLPHPNCSMLYSCFGGDPNELLCPPGLHFNFDAQICLPSEIAGCVEGAAPTQPDAAPADPPPSPTTELPPSTDTPIRTCETVFDFLPHPNCSMFYSCFGGVPKEQYCPNGLHWNTHLQWCVFPELAKCVEGYAPIQPDTNPSTDRPTPPPPETPVPTQPRPRTTTAEPTTEEFMEPTTEIASRQPRNDCADVIHYPEDVLLPHPDCSQFYQCHWGRPIERPCSVGLHFRPDLSVCDFPIRANCVQGAAPEQRADF